MVFLLSFLQLSYTLNIFSLLSIGTYGFSYSEFSIILIAAFITFQVVWNGKPLRIPARTDLYFIVGIWVAFALSAVAVLFTADKSFVVQTGKTFAHMTMIWTCAMAIMVYPIKNEQWITVLRVNIVIALVVSLYAMYQLPARALDWPLGWIEVSNASFGRGLADGADTKQLALQFADFYRATSIFSEPSSLAGYSASTLILLLVPMLSGTKPLFRSNTFTWISISLSLIALLIAFSLTGVMLLAGFGMLATVLFGKRALRSMMHIGIVTVAVLVTTNYLVYSLTQFDVLETFAARIVNVSSGAAGSELADENIVGESYTQRTSDYTMSVSAWVESPLLGVGPGCFSQSESGKKHNSPFVTGTINNALAELGIVGAVAVIGLLSLCFVELLIDYRQWSRASIKLDSDDGTLVAIMPFKMIQLIITAFTANWMINAVEWSTLAMIISTSTSFRTTLGQQKIVNVFVVERPFKETIARWLQKGNKVGTDY